MKRILFIICMLAGLNAGAQIFTVPNPDNTPKPTYTHIVVYRTWSNNMYIANSLGSMKYSWVTHIDGFTSLKDVMDWLNSGMSSYEDHKTVMIGEEELIAIYDLTTAKEIKVILKIEKKSKPKQVIIEHEEWENSQYEIVNKK